MEKLTTLQDEFNVNDFDDASAFQFLESQFSTKEYKTECNSCEYYKEDKCAAGSSICTYSRKFALADLYRV